MPSFKDSLGEFQKLKNEPLKTKLEYIFTYYWIPILVVAVLLVVLISQIIHLTSVKETVLSGHCINATAESADADKFIADFAISLGVDSEKSEISILTSQFLPSASYDSYVANQLITAKIATKSLDFIVADPETLLLYAYQESFCDLCKVLSPAQFQKFTDHFLYMDSAQITNPDIQSSQSSVYPDPTAPNSMQQAVPFAVQIPPDSEFAQLYYPDADSPIAIAVLDNAPNPTLAVSFVDYICDKCN